MRQADDLGLNTSDCKIFTLFQCILFSLLPLQSVGRSYLEKGLHYLVMLIKKRRKEKNTMYMYVRICINAHTFMRAYVHTHTYI